MANQDPTPSTGAGPRRGRRGAQALIGLVAVIGVVAMHGFTMNHDVAMVSMGAGHNASVTFHASDSGHGAVVADALAMGSLANDLPRVVRADGAAAVDALVLRASPAPGAHVMATACLAFLTGLLLLFGASRLLARLRRGSRASRLPHNVAWLATAVERLQPVLAELSVLRT